MATTNSLKNQLANKQNNATKTIPKSTKKIGNGNKHATHTNVCLFVISLPYTTGNIGIPAVR